MFRKLIEVLREPPQSPPAGYGAPFDRKLLAVAALLVEASQVDRHNDPVERAAVARLLPERFQLGGDEVERLVRLAEGSLAAALEDWIFAKAVRDGFTPAERIEVIGMMWEVVYAAGTLERFEKSLILRIAGELGVSEEEAEASRLAALSRLGMDSAR